MHERPDLTAMINRSTEETTTTRYSAEKFQSNESQLRGSADHLLSLPRTEGVEVQHKPNLWHTQIHIVVSQEFLPNDTRVKANSTLGASYLSCWLRCKLVRKGNSRPLPCSLDLRLVITIRYLDLWFPTGDSSTLGVHDQAPQGCL